MLNNAMCELLNFASSHPFYGKGLRQKVTNNRGILNFMRFMDFQEYLHVKD